MPGELGPHVRLHLVLRERGALAQYDEGLQAGSEVRVRDAHDSRVGDVLVLEQEILDLARKDVLAAGDDHVVVTSVDEQKSVFVEMSDVTGGQQAVELVGLPEGVLPMTQAVTYLALAPKSNRALTTYAAARKLVKEHGALPVPAKLRPASNAAGRALGHGESYKYPHDFEGAYVAEDYLPDALVGTRIYQPGDSGFEAELARRRADLDAKKK